MHLEIISDINSSVIDELRLETPPINNNQQDKKQLSKVHNRHTQKEISTTMIKMEPLLMNKKTLLCSSLTLILQGLFLNTAYASQDKTSLDLLKDSVESQSQRITELENKLELTADMLEQNNDSAFSSNNGSTTTIGGYGELHYNSLKNQKKGGKDKKEIDLHRAILFVGHDFNEKIRFWSELEIEHAQSGDGKSGGEVSMEQAYVEFDIDNRVSIKSGIFLVPAGIINETHEPPTFYGVERNPVEKNIIPTTWREGGVSLSARVATAWSFDAAIHSGLSTTSDKNYSVRSGRKAVRKAPANDLAVTGRVKWTGMPGLELAATAQYQSDITQSEDSDAGNALLTETHAVWSKGPYALRALYATWALSGDAPKNIGADKQSGWYVEPSYKINSQWGVFTRYNQWDNQAGNSSDSEYTQVDAGVNYWPHPMVSVKVDYQRQSTPENKDNYDGFNLGVGYQF